MSISYDLALYLDLELTCGVLPQGEAPSIIQIGICEADLNQMKVTRMSSFFVRPMRPFTITDECTLLTTITREEVLKGKYLNEVLNTLKKLYSTQKKMCITWGNDKDALDNACINPFKNMADISWCHKLAHINENAMSLSKALQMEGLIFPGRCHNAVDDAHATALLHMKMITKARNNT